MPPGSETGFFGNVLKDDWTAVHESAGSDWPLLLIEYGSVDTAGGYSALVLRGCRDFIGFLIAGLGTRESSDPKKCQAQKKDMPPAKAPFRARCNVAAWSLSASQKHFPRLGF